MCWEHMYMYMSCVYVGCGATRLAWLLASDGERPAIRIGQGRVDGERRQMDRTESRAMVVWVALSGLRVVWVACRLRVRTDHIDMVHGHTAVCNVALKNVVLLFTVLLLP